MSQIDNHATLWSNVRALMIEHWGKVNLNRLARDCEIGPATVVRIKEQNTSVGLETMEKIADHFGVAVWQLLVPGMDPKNPPVLQPMLPGEKILHEKIMKVTKEIMCDAEAVACLTKKTD